MTRVISAFVEPARDLSAYATGAAAAFFPLAAFGIGALSGDVVQAAVVALLTIPIVVYYSTLFAAADWVLTRGERRLGEFARPWKGTRVVGPHVVEPVHDPVNLHDNVDDLHGRFSWQWRCKYCDASGVHLASFGLIPTDCGEFEWLDSEREAIRPTSHD